MAFSNRVRDLRSSPVRDMLSIGQRPDVISFAGGLPAADSFETLTFAPPPPHLLQYGPTEGEPLLREHIAAELRALGLSCPPERVLVLSGSQQGIDLVAKLYVDAGSRVAVEAPSYLAALQVFRFFGASFEDLDASAPGCGWSQTARPELVYVTPTFQNPTGRCWTAAARAALAEACDRTGATLFEDDPYRDLAYDPCDRTPICAGIKSASWVYQGSFSKTLAPGLRIGFLAASEDVFSHLVHLKQAADLHTNRIGQWVALQHLADPERSRRQQRLVDAYRRKRDLFETHLRASLDDLATWEAPPGGLFFWLVLNPDIDGQALLKRAMDRNVLYTPGDHFYAAPGDRPSAMRLNFSYADERSAQRGIGILGDLLREARASAGAGAAVRA